MKFELIPIYFFFFIDYHQRLMAERDKLLEANEEMKFAQLNHETTSTMIDGSPTTTGSVDTLDMIPPEIR